MFEPGQRQVFVGGELIDGVAFKAVDRSTAQGETGNNARLHLVYHLGLFGVLGQGEVVGEGIIVSHVAGAEDFALLNRTGDRHPGGVGNCLGDKGVIERLHGQQPFVASELELGQIIAKETPAGGIKERDIRDKTGIGVAHGKERGIAAISGGRLAIGDKFRPRFGRLAAVETATFIDLFVPHKDRLVAIKGDAILFAQECLYYMPILGVVKSLKMYAIL